MGLQVKTGIKILYGTGIGSALLALVLLVADSWGSFLAALAVSLGFIGLGWAGKRVLLPDSGKSPLHGLSLLIMVIFGGAGLAMLAGSAALLIDGDFAGSTAMLVFGLVFCAAAYFGSRAFAEPTGSRAVRIDSGTKPVQGEMGQSGEVTQTAYVYVDEKTTDAEVENMQKNWAEKPWTRRQDWAQAKVVQQGVSDMRLLAAFTVIWNVIGWGIAGYGIVSEWDSTDVPWFLAVFPAVGIALAVLTLRTWIRKRKFGISILHCQTMPFHPGGWLQATLRTGIPVKQTAQQEFCVRLTCARRTTMLDRDGDERVTEKNLWEHVQTVPGSLCQEGTAFQVSVAIAIPADLPCTVLYPEDNRTVWRLSITSSVKGVDYAALFEVPVYEKTAGS